MISMLENTISIIAENNYHCLMCLPNVIGVGLGDKYINGVNTGRPCLHVLVSKKVPDCCLNCRCRIPKCYMGIETDVQEVGQFSHLSYKGRKRPLEGGYSIAPDGTNIFGTLSCIVVRHHTVGSKDYFALGNNHILAGYNTLKIGTEITQPASADGGVPIRDTIGKLAEFVKLEFSSTLRSPKNYVDAALVKLSSSSLASDKLADGSVLKGYASGSKGQSVKKIGRTTGVTSGSIKTTNATIKVHDAGQRPILYAKQLIVNISVSPGDSGAILLNSDNKALGLLCAGSSKNAVFNDFSQVLKLTKTILYTE